MRDNSANNNLVQRFNCSLSLFSCLRLTGAEFKDNTNEWPVHCRPDQSHAPALSPPYCQGQSRFQLPAINLRSCNSLLSTRLQESLHYNASPHAQAARSLPVLPLNVCRGGKVRFDTDPSARCGCVLSLSWRGGKVRFATDPSARWDCILSLTTGQHCAGTY